MKNAHNYNYNYEKIVVLVHAGAFCRAYDEAALVLTALTGYQITEQKNRHIRCGFRKSMVKDIEKLLREHHVSYVELLTNPDNDDAKELASYRAPDDSPYMELYRQGQEIYRGKKSAERKLRDMIVEHPEPEIDERPAGSNTTDAIQANGRQFIEDLCNCIHPITKEKITMLDLNEPDIIRGLFAIKERLCYGK